MMQPLQVYAMDIKFNRVTVNIPYTSLQWNRKYYEVGTFEMCVPVDVYDKSWKYIGTTERYEVGIVQKVEYSDEGVYGQKDTVVVSGFFLEEMLNSRTFLDESPQKILVQRTRELTIPTRWEDAYTFDLYKGDDGNYYYFNMIGNLVGSVEDDSSISFDSGVTNQDKGEGEYWKPDYDSITVNTPGGKVNATYIHTEHEGISNFYVTDKTNGTVTYWEPDFSEGYGLTEHTGQLLFDQGNQYWYTGEDGQIHMAYGAAYITEESQVPIIQDWKISTGELSRVYYEEVIVESAWQRLEDSESLLEAGEVISKAVGWVQALFGDMINWTVTDIKGSTKILYPSFKRCADFLYETFKEEGVSFRLKHNFVNNALVFEVWKGQDRTQAQTEMPWAVFSDDFGTIRDFKYTTDDSNYRNTCYVLYDYREPAWDEKGMPIIDRVWNFDESGMINTGSTTSVRYEEKQGYITARLPGTEEEETKEAYLDCRNDQCPLESLWADQSWDGDAPSSVTDEWEGLKKKYEDYYKSFEQKGTAYLSSSYTVERNLDVGEYVVGGYMVDFDLGDIVETGVEKLGAKETARITAAYEKHEAGKSTVELEFGESTLEVS